MSLSANLTSVAAFRDYVEDFAPDLISKAFFQPRTIAMSTTHEGVKGKKVLTILEIAEELAVAWKSDFSAKSNAVNFVPRELDVYPMKVDLSFTPQEFESSYLGSARKKGQNAGQDLPFAGFIMEKLMARQGTSIDLAMWKAVRAGTVTPGVTPMSQTFDGYLELIKDLVTGGLSTVATPGGSVTKTNIIELVESMWDSLGDAYKETTVALFMSWANFMLYQRAYRDEFGKYTGMQTSNQMTLDFGQNVTLYAMPGLSGSNRIIMTPVDNLHAGYDDFDDMSTFQFEQSKRQMDFYMDYKLGAQIAITDDEVLVVNDLE